MWWVLLEAPLAPWLFFIYGGEGKFPAGTSGHSQGFRAADLRQLVRCLFCSLMLSQAGWNRMSGL